MRTLIRLAWASPVGRVIIILLILAAIGIFVWENISEYKEGERLRERDRK